MSAVTRSALAVGSVGVGTAFYASVIERNAFVVRRLDVPVLTPGATPVRVLHVSDLHITVGQHRKQQWIRKLARLEPDLVVNTGDTLSALDAMPAVLHALEPLAQFPAVFVPGNNDYFAPVPRSPTAHFRPNQGPPADAKPLPWPQLAAAMVDQGWTDLTHVRTAFDIANQRIALAGTDDPYLGRARYELIEGTADADAVVRLGVSHAPEPSLLERYAHDCYDLVLAGHTHGGQVRIPFGSAIVTNCGIDRARARWLHPWDDHMFFHVSAGLGTNPYTPVRFCCRPEATLLTLVPRG